MRSILAVSLLSLSIIIASPSRVTALSPLEESCATSIDAVERSYFQWTEAVCPVYRDVVEFYVELGRSDIAGLLAEIYAEAVWDVAEAKILAVTEIASGCAEAGGNVDGFAEEAIEDISAAHDECIGKIIEPLLLSADFDKDGDVDGEDYLIWQESFLITEGVTANEGDADGDGDVDGEDFLIWQDTFGTGVATARASSGATVRETDRSSTGKSQSRTITRMEIRHVGAR